MISHSFCIPYMCEKDPLLAPDHYHHFHNPELHQGEILSAVLQPEARPQTVDGLNVEDLPADLLLGLHQQVRQLGGAASVGPGLGLSSKLEYKQVDCQGN